MAKKPNRKGLMEVLAEYQKEKGYGPKEETSESKPPKREVRNGVIYIDGKKSGYEGKKPETTSPAPRREPARTNPAPRQEPKPETGGTPKPRPVSLKKPDKPKIGETKVHRGERYRYDGSKWINIGKVSTPRRRVTTPRQRK